MTSQHISIDKFTASDRLGALLTALLVSAPGLFDLARESSAVGIILLTLAPASLLAIRTRSLPLSEPIFLLGVMWILAASLPSLLPHISPDLYRDRMWAITSPWAIDTAALWMYRGWAMCCIFYWGSSLVLPQTPTQYSTLQIAKEDYLRLAVGITGLAATAVFLISTGFESYTHLDGYSSSTTFDQIISDLHRLAVIYIFLYFHAAGTNRNVERDRLLIVAILLEFLFVFAATSSKGTIIQLLAMWFLAHAANTTSRKASSGIWRICVLLVLFYATFTFVTAYRQELAMQPTNKSESVVETLNNQWSAAATAFTRSITGDTLRLQGDDEEIDTGSMLDRVALLSAFSVIVDITGGEPPLENAIESLLAPIYSFLPRDLLTEKTVFFHAGALAELLGISFGGYSVTLPGSLYWAWGWAGIAIGMAAIGYFLALSNSRASQPGTTGIIWRVVLAAYVIQLLEIGGGFQFVVTSTMRTAMFLIPLAIIASHLANRSTARTTATAVPDTGR